MTLAQFEPPLSAWLTVHCPHKCSWTRDYGFSDAGLNMANMALLDHMSQHHPRAWRRHCLSTTRAALAVQMQEP